MSRLENPYPAISEPVSDTPKNVTPLHPLPEERTFETEARDDFQESLSTIRLRPALSIPESLEKIGQGLLCIVEERAASGSPTKSDEERQQDAGGTLKIYGRSTTVAERAGHDKVILVKWVRRANQLARA